MARLHIAPCLWFDDQAEEAAEYYVGIFPNSRITETARYTEIGREFHGKEPGSVMTVEFELDGNRFIALNGGPIFKFSEAISFEILCKNQEEVDYYWDRLTVGGDPSAQQCGWLKDKFGLSWQVTPEGFYEMMKDPESEGARRAMTAMFQMKKLDLGELQRAYEGVAA